MSDKPRVLILGGAGFIGRNLVTFLANNNCASYIRVVDKALLEGAFLDPHHIVTFKNPIVEYHQMNLLNPAAVQKAFVLDGNFNIVINLACETKYGQSDDVYQEKVVKIALNCAQEAVKTKVGKFIEVSSCQVYPNEKKNACKEDSKLAPWTNLAKFKLQTEESLKKSC